MAPEMVTIEKNYLETLMRRAQFHTSNDDVARNFGVGNVSIPKQEHLRLLNAVREYENLRRNLFLGGIEEATLNVLTKDDNPAESASTIPATTDAPETSTAFMTQIPPATPRNSNPNAPMYSYNNLRNGALPPRTFNGYSNGGFQHNGFQQNGFHNHSHANGNDADVFSYNQDGTADGYYEFGNGQNDFQRFQRPIYDKYAQRTVHLGNLPENVTHAEVCDVVRGGMLLDIYLRTHDHSAAVSFLEAAHAQEFIRHVKRNNLYIRGRRLDIRWNERQFILPGHVANKIGIGATRNLVIHNCNPKHTEEEIRNHLEHIHNLTVVKITFSGSDCFISTNSVHNALFARTCMMSRTTYKGSKIEWDDDECAAPYEKPRPARQTTPSTKKASPPINRFELLNVTDTEEESEIGDLNTTGTDSFFMATPSKVPAVAAWF